MVDKSSAVAASGTTNVDDKVELEGLEQDEMAWKDLLYVGFVRLCKRVSPFCSLMTCLCGFLAYFPLPLGIVY